MTLDSDHEINPGWPDYYRQIFIIAPRSNSKRLRFYVPVSNESAEFTIEPRLSAVNAAPKTLHRAYSGVTSPAPLPDGRSLAASAVYELLTLG